jgi:hypothetical protein
MNEQRDFFKSFDTTYENWQRWTKTPEGTMAILKDPWKGEFPKPGQTAEQVLAMIRERQNKQ